MLEKKRVYILVKTYPTISEKYAELVCTAGVLEDGSWIRLYPMPFRLLSDEQKYPKYTSLAIFKPTKILDFVIEEDERDWDAKKLASLHAESKQMHLFKI